MVKQVRFPADDVSKEFTPPSMADTLASLPGVRKPFEEDSSPAPVGPKFESKAVVQDISKIDRSADDAANARALARKSAPKAESRKPAASASSSKSTPRKAATPASATPSRAATMRKAFSDANRPMPPSGGAGMKGVFERANAPKPPNAMAEAFKRANAPKPAAPAAAAPAAKPKPKADQSDKARADRAKRAAAQRRHKPGTPMTYAKGGMTESPKMMKKEVDFFKKKKAPKELIKHEEGELKKAKKGKKPFPFAKGGAIDGCAQRGKTRCKTR